MKTKNTNNLSLDTLCDELLQRNHKSVVMQKTASLHTKMPSQEVLVKIAHEIRELTKPVEITYNDLNEFIEATI